MAGNRREEIKKKEALQAKFQLSMAQNNARAMSWLTPSSSATSASSSTKPISGNTANTSKVPGSNQNIDDSNDEFMNLRVIPPGSGLGSTKSTQRIGDFFQQFNTDPNSNKLKNKDNTNNNAVGDVRRNGGSAGNSGSGGSRAMNALLNKMRNENREKIKQNQDHNISTKKGTVVGNLSSGGRKTLKTGDTISAKKGTGFHTGGMNGDNDSDSDPDMDALRARASIKKNTSMGRVGKKARPF